MKKFSKLLLVGLLVFSMAVPAFAGEGEEPETETGLKSELDEVTYEEDADATAGATGVEVTSDGEAALPEIKVTIPTSFGFLINPYNLEGAGQIVSAEAKITNNSDVPVEVTLKEATTNLGEEDFKLGAVSNKTTEKTMELNLLVDANEGDRKDPTGNKVYAKSTLITGQNKDVKLVTLAEAKKTKDEEGDEVTVGQVANLKYGGKVVENPVKVEGEGDSKTTVADPWTEEDAVEVTSVYTFVPVMVQ